MNDFLDEFKKNIKKFHKELEEKISLNPEKEEFIGIRFDDIGMVHHLNMKLEENYERLEKINTNIDILEREIKDLKKMNGGKKGAINAIKEIEISLKLKKKELEEINESVKKARNYDLEQDDILGVGFINISNLEKELEEITRLLKKSNEYLVKLIELKNSTRYPKRIAR